jgi:hypothetical protein
MMMEPVSVHWDPRVLDSETRSDVLWFPSQPPDNPQAELGASICHRLRVCGVWRVSVHVRGERPGLQVAASASPR